MSRRERGVALVLTLAVLAVLSLLASTFVRLTIVERSASSAYVDRVRARMLAEAGTERAVAHLVAHVVGASHDGMGDAWVCGDAADVPVHRLASPSLPGGVAHGRAYSGLLGADLGSFEIDVDRSRAGAYALDGDQYALRITDLSARLDLGRPEASGEGALRLLKTLCGRLGVSSAGAAALTDDAPRTRDALARALGPEAWSALSPYLTVHGWRDDTALAPLVRSDDELPALERVADGRAPLHLNLAPKLLLAASLEGVRARWYDPDTKLMRTVSFDAARADAIAELLDVRRRVAPFEGLDDLEGFLAGLVGGELDAEEAALVLVHADPDARLVKLNPDAARFGALVRRPFDRSDLDRYTVEWTCRTSGVYRIESHGRVIGPRSSVVARATVDSVVRLATRRRLTAQDDWTEHGTTAHLRSYPEADATDGHPAIGSLGLARAPQGGETEWFEPTSLEPVMSSTPAKEGTATIGKATAGADRFADGLHAHRTHVRYAAYDASTIGKEAGSIELWWKPDHDSRTRTGALLYLDQPTGDGTGFSTVLYQRAGMLFASRTRYRVMGGVPAHYTFASKSPKTVLGKLRPDAAATLEQLGIAWLKGKKPGLPHYYYAAYGRQFRIRVFAAVGRGAENDVFYIYDFEKTYGYAHVGCITQYIHIPDYYDILFESGYEVVSKSVDTTAFIDVVDESGNEVLIAKYVDGSEPYAASRVERGIALGPGLDPHRWYHLRLAWTDGTDVRLFLDGAESRDHARWYGPATPWSSRLVSPDGRLYAGPIRLNRASGQGGTLTPELTGKTLLLGHHGTLEGLSVRPTGGARAPGVRYVADGTWEGAVAGPDDGRLVRATLRATVPAGCHAALAASADGSGASLELSLSRPDAAGAVSPFAHSITLIFAQPPAVLVRRER